MVLGADRPAATSSSPFPIHATWCSSFCRVLVRLRSSVGKRQRTRRRINPFFRSTQIYATPSGRSRIGSGMGTDTTVPSSARRRVMVDEQRSQSQKYSTRLGLRVRTGGSVSIRKSFPSCRWRNEAEQEGLLHFVSIPAPHYVDFLLLCPAMQPEPSPRANLRVGIEKSNPLR